MAFVNSSHLNALAEAVRYGVLMGAGHEYRVVRARADSIPMEAPACEAMAWLDALVLEHLCTAEDGEVWPALLEDDAAEPLAHWWWHLGAIRVGTYPAAELPEALRAVYLE